MRQDFFFSVLMISDCERTFTIQEEIVVRNKAASITLFPGILLILSPSGVTQAFRGTGSGTEQDPYIIKNVYELQQINSELDACYELANDIDASDIRYWNDKAGFIPIGD